MRKFDLAKRLVFCFDGTWNRLDAKTPTNVVLTAESVVPTAKDGTAQLIWYDEGVGTTKRERFTGGIFGHGVEPILADAYRFLIFNYTPGDDIFVFGFSRGAYTARSFVGLLRNCGIVRRSDAGRTAEAIRLYRSRSRDTSPDALKMNLFRQEASPNICVSPHEDQWRAETLDGYRSGSLPILDIRYLGVWDTVGALGIPQTFGALSHWWNRKYEFHDTVLTPRVACARHAVAIDERRKAFAPSLWDNLDTMNELRGTTSAAADAPYQQKWFPGTHGSVGGGGDRRGLSDQALDWIWDGARAAGLELDTALDSRVWQLAPSERDPLDNMREKAAGLKTWAMGLLPRADRSPGPQTLHELSVSAKRRWHEDREALPERRRYRPPTLADVTIALERLKPEDLGVTAADDGCVSEGFTLHEVRRGETLASIALDYYGEVAKYRQIYDANRNKLSDPSRIYCGQMLRIPDAPVCAVPPAPRAEVAGAERGGDEGAAG